MTFVKYLYELFVNKIKCFTFHIICDIIFSGLLWTVTFFCAYGDCRKAEALTALGSDIGSNLKGVKENDQ